MTRHSSPADRRPFQPRAELENQEALEDRYGEVAIQDILEALRYLRTASVRDRDDRAA